MLKNIIITICIVLIIICLSYYKYCNIQSNNIDIFLVSLEKDIERRSKLNIIPNYTIGIDGSKLDITKLIEENKVDKSCNLKKGEIGCFLSHVELLKKAYESKKIVLILEDDAKIENDTMDKIQQVLKNVPDDFEMIFLGYNYYEEEYTFKNSKYLHGAHAYIVNGKKLSLEKINKLFPFILPYDVALPKIFKTYIIIPKVIELGEFGSISNTQGIN